MSFRKLYKNDSTSNGGGRFDSATLCVPSLRWNRISSGVIPSLFHYHFSRTVERQIPLRHWTQQHGEMIPSAYWTQ
eukprot:scaffold43068_cov328-Amphora_coffeaeformis.AAC.1